VLAQRQAVPFVSVEEIFRAHNDAAARFRQRHTDVSAVRLPQHGQGARCVTVMEVRTTRITQIRADANLAWMFHSARCFIAVRERVRQRDVAL
jgi:hypothetical protein